MARKYIDCREYKGSNCSVRISGEESEVLPLVRQHAMDVHKDSFKDMDQLDNQLKQMLKDDMQDQVGKSQKIA